jgi:hypothetical protein
MPDEIGGAVGFNGHTSAATVAALTTRQLLVDLFG